ncbi:DUF2242 domain-containing protein [Pseudomonas sp. FSL R10-0056]|uniref:DUF2242 domain-containing protein n=1 Tax=Pseudomonas TaxID=286 RepID=UPI0011B364A6|nr:MULTISPECIES: DUF2242 domain-containing protein [Pseudomonas]MDY7570181.1 DUF2242 domain-containing protein [Pseudomonas sp. CCC4.1]MEB0144877.1 DUF2242 domain-containing protein [Pseudomonas sp. CCC4.1]MQT61960.1 DUF2242 domain-containing protein [Pseudomonas sp. FSL R10-0056]MQT71298.1 DUF2242 domain-containing protein [Pseudomonas sp. FSL R10-0071]MQU50980.1 DUF2242 domain-containing protein [Pseudomonas sp. FSL A6-1183]
MLMSFPVRAVVVALVLTGLAGCSSKKTAIYEHENFDDSGTFSRNYPVTDKTACESARRALLSQGYIITSNDPKMISGHKSFQQTGESHLEISFNIVCADDGGSEHHATMFANALQDRYALKKVNNSASLGVGVLGSVSMPIGSTDDSMVKVASETVSSAQFYDRFFGLVEVFLPKPKEVVKAVKAPQKAKPDLGVPEPAPVPTEVIVPAPEPVIVPEPVVAPASEPVLLPPAAAEPVLPVLEAPVTVPAVVAPVTPVVEPVTEPAITPVPAAVEPSPVQ